MKARTHNGKLAQVRDWEAKRRGAIYCAPACGRGCTWAEYQAALDQSAKVVARLTVHCGPGWKAHVHENLGWFWSVYRGPIAVHGSTHNGRTTYSCLMGDSPTQTHSGALIWHDGRCDYPTPQAAVTAQLKLAWGVLQSLHAAFQAAGGHRAR